MSASPNLTPTVSAQPWQQFQAPADYLQGRVILVTGAGQGLGEVAALEYARLGATVVLLGRNEKKLGKVYDAIEAAGGAQPAAIPVDLAKMNDQDCVNLANLLWKEFDRLDGVLHCANGFNHLSPLINQKLEEWVEMFRANVAAPYAITRAVLPMLKRADDASVVFVGEQHALEPKAFWGGFAVSKAGQLALAQIAADEWDKEENLRVNTLIPGPIRSPFRLKTHPGEVRESLPAPEALLPALTWLMGSDSRGQTGHCYQWQQQG